MITFGQFLRLVSIQRVLIRHGLDEIILATHLFRPVRFLLYLLPWNWVRAPYGPRAERLRHVLEELGPIFVKFGQLLSTRRDLLPDDIALELAKLQDSVSPFPGAEAVKIIETTYGHPLNQVFSEFDETPLASASIAQVHAAKLRDGREVVVKVVRPGIRKLIQRDMGLLRIMAEIAERHTADGRRLRPSRVVNEYEKIILDELDLVREAANASQLKRNFEGAENFYVPEIVWDLTQQQVMVMERVRGITIDKAEELRRAGVDLKQLAETGVDLFFTQVFRDRFFHADMHPGNLFVLPAKDGLPLRIVPVDFGIMGSLSDFDQRYLADNFMAFIERDYRRVAELHVESAWVPPGTRVDDFEFAIRTVCEPMFERPLKDISFGHMLLRLFQTAQRFHMEVLPQMMLLQKTLINIEGVGRQLYPELDLWHTGKPSLERWMRERVSIRKMIDGTRENLPNWAERLPQLPSTFLQMLDKAKAGELAFTLHAQGLEEIRQEIRHSNRRTVFSIIGAGFLISSALVLGLYFLYSPMQLETLLPDFVWVIGGMIMGMILAGMLREK